MNFSNIPQFLLLSCWICFHLHFAVHAPWFESTAPPCFSQSLSFNPLPISSFLSVSLPPRLVSGIRSTVCPWRVTSTSSSWPAPCSTPPSPSPPSWWVQLLFSPHYFNVCRGVFISAHCRKRFCNGKRKQPFLIGQFQVVPPRFSLFAFAPSEHDTDFGSTTFFTTFFLFLIHLPTQLSTSIPSVPDAFTVDLGRWETGVSSYLRYNLIGALKKIEIPQGSFSMDSVSSSFAFAWPGPLGMKYRRMTRIFSSFCYMETEKWSNEPLPFNQL